LGQDQTSKKEDKQVAPDKGNKLSHAHIEDVIHAVRQNVGSGEGKFKGSPVLNNGYLRETTVQF
jgi:hypothetical protein